MSDDNAGTIIICFSIYIFLIYCLKNIGISSFLHYFTDILTQCGGLLPKVQHFIEVISILQQAVS